MLKFVNAEKRVHDTVVFPSFDLEVAAGEVIALYSSVNIREQLIDLLLGRAVLSQGMIQVDGKELRKKQPELGFMFLQSSLYERLTIEEMLQFTHRLHQSGGTVESAMRALRLEELRGKRIKQLSFSETKRVQLASLVLQDPSVFVLEEPDQNLDLESKQIYLSLLHELRGAGKAIFILTGNLESAVTAADQVCRLDHNGLQIVQMEEEDTGNEAKEIESSQSVRFEKIPTKVNDKIVLFNPPEIEYIESNEGQSFLHIKGESFPTVFTLQELEMRLLPFGFFRCHRSYIVNLQKVREVITWTRNSYSLILDDAPKTTIPLSKTKMSELKEMLGLK